MTWIDWSIVGLYVGAALLIGFYFVKRAAASTTDFFVAGRSLPWYIAGTSMVATTFSSDTPLWVAGAVREEGIYAVWIMWAGVLGTLATVFFFARLWRRSRVLTEIEFISRRYDASRAMHGLRIFKALFDGVFVNCIIMASVTLAMSKILAVILGLSPEPIFLLPVLGPVTPDLALLALLGITALLYTILSGLYGVVYTDLIQFTLAMVGAIALAVIVWLDLSAKGGVLLQLQTVPEFRLEQLNMFPEFGWDLETATFFILVTVSWLFLAPGTGFYLQRVFATRSEKDAMLSIYWYCFCNYVLRSWPWIIVGVASLVYFPALADAEQAYPEMIDAFLPIGLKGIMVASLLAAFMSTLDTHMNWGASYIINDIYQPYLAQGRDRRHYITAARCAMAVLIVIAILIGTRLTGLLDAYKYLFVFWGGISFVLIARWYWWRINIWSEIVTLAMAAIVGNLLFILLPDQPGEDWFAVRMLINFIVTTVVCIAVTYLTTRDGPSSQAVEFYKRMRIQGAGWSRVRRITGIAPLDVGFRDNAIAWSASVLFIFGLLFASGYALFGDWSMAGLYSLVTLVAAMVVHKKFKAVTQGLES